MHWEHASLVGNTSLHMIYEQLMHPHKECIQTKTSRKVVHDFTL